MLFVIDTNVFISAVLLPYIVPAKALDLALFKGNLLFSESTNRNCLKLLKEPNSLNIFLQKRKIICLQES